MRDDEMMDELLKTAMAADVPDLSPGFDRRLQERLRPARLTSSGRIAMWIYALVALTVSVWFMRALPLTWIGLALLATVAVAAGSVLYGRRFVSVE